MIFIIISAIFNAFMDRVDWDFSTSIVRKLSPKFWFPNVSYMYCKKILGYHLDAWHITKTLMLWCLFMPISITLKEKHPILSNQVDYIIYFIATGVVWSVVFNIFFNYIFEHKND